MLMPKNNPRAAWRAAREFTPRVCVGTPEMSMASKYNTGVSGAFPQAGSNMALSRTILSVGTMAPRRALVRINHSQSFLTLVVNTLLGFRRCPRQVRLSSWHIFARSIHRSGWPHAACSLCRSPLAPAFCWRRPFGGCGEKRDARAVVCCRRSGRKLAAACTGLALILRRRMRQEVADIDHRLQ
jgi:hypothetical protein